MVEIRVDLPTLGKPISPTSAISFSSRVTWMSSPGRPGLANLGTWRVGVAKCALPKPPRPPLATTTGSWLDRSAMTSPLAVSLMTVPMGTLMTRSGALAPWQLLPRPLPPASAVYLRL